MFFIISSYLIVGILWRNLDQNKLSITRFYFKRILRTFPAFYIYLIIVFCFLYFIDFFTWDQFWRAPLYLENYHPRSLWTQEQWFVGHSWSLAVEEQFYFLIAILFLIGQKRQWKERHFLSALIFIFFFVPMIRVSYFFLDSLPDFILGSVHRSFETVADALAIGGIIFFLKDNKILLNILPIINKYLWISILIIGLVLLSNSQWIRIQLGYGPKIFYNAIGISILNFILALSMICLIKFPNQNWFSRLLNHPFLILIGLWSYSIYLWQQVWLYKWELPLILKIIGLLICSLGSYYLIEQPALKWRDKKVNIYFPRG